MFFVLEIFILRLRPLYSHSGFLGFFLECGGGDLRRLLQLFPGNVILNMLTMNIKFQYLYILKSPLRYVTVQFLQLSNFEKDKRQDKTKTFLALN